MRVTPVVPIRDRSVLYKCAEECACQTVQKGQEERCGIVVPGGCAQSSHECLVLFLCRLVLAGEKPGTEQDEVKLQNASKQIVQTAILRAVQQVSQESQQQEKRTNSSASLQLERGKLTKKHEKK
nr:PREDICTED: putative uncharacterized protein C18orf42 homolog [Opisthocomus hoazin]